MRACGHDHPHASMWLDESGTGKATYVACNAQTILTLGASKIEMLVCPPAASPIRSILAVTNRCHHPHD